MMTHTHTMLKLPIFTLSLLCSAWPVKLSLWLQYVRASSPGAVCQAAMISSGPSVHVS